MDKNRVFVLRYIYNFVIDKIKFHCKIHDVYLLRFCLFVLFTLIIFDSFAQSNGDYRTRYVDNADYSWDTATNWQVYNGGWNTASQVPSSTSNVTVRSGSKYSTSNTASCAKLIIEAGGILNLNANSVFTVNGTTTIDGNLILSAYNSSPIFKGLVTLNNGAFNNSGNIPVTFQGGFNVTGGTYTPGTQIINFTTNNQTLTGVINFGSAPINISGITLTNNSNLTIGGQSSGNGSFNNTATVTLLGSVYHNFGNLSNSGTLTVLTSGGFGTQAANFTNTGTVNFNGSGYIAGITNNAGGIINIQNTGHTFGTVNNATASSVLNVSANYSVDNYITNLNATVSGNVVNYTGGNQTIKPTTYDNLFLKNSGLKTFSSNSTMINSLLSLEGTATVSGTLAYGSNAKLRYTTTNARTVGVEWPATFTALGGIEIQNTGGALSLDADKVLANNVPLVIKSGGTLNTTTSNRSLTLGGAFTNSGTFTPNNSTITLSGTSPQAISTSSALTFYNLTVNGTGLKTLTGTYNVSNALTLTSGMLAVSTNLTVTNTAASAITGGSASSYINGSVRRAIPSGTATGAYLFPTGTTSLYLPLTITNPISSAAETVSVAATSANVGGSVNATLLSKSTTEYWSLTSTNLTGGALTLARPSAISPYDVVGASATQTGAYGNLGGTAAANSVSNSNTVGSNRFFVFAQKKQEITTGTIASSIFCSGAAVSVPYTITGVFVNGNIFTAQLSDASGSFTTPVNIGTLTSTSSGTIAATIPANTPTGSGYRIRVISSNPVITGTANSTNLTIAAIPSAPTTTGSFICIGAITGTVLSASGAVSGEVYKWYSAATGGTLLKTSSNNTDNVYTTPVILTTTNYWVSIQNAGGCESARTQVTATYPSVSTGNQNLAGTDTWIGHVYDGTNFENYYGTMNSSDLPSVTFDHNFGAAATCFPFNNGGSPRSIQTETFSVRYRMNSTLKGLFAVELGSDDGSRLTIDGLNIYNNWGDQGFSLRSNVLIRLSGASPLLYEFYENAGENRVVFQNLTRLIENTLNQNTNQSLLLGATGSTINGDVFSTLPAGISLSGTGYQWKYSTTPGGARTNITNATAASYTPSTSSAPFNVPGTYYLYRDAVLTSGNNTNVNPYVSSLESNAAVVAVLMPTVSSSVGSLSGFSYLINNGPSAQQSFTVTGSNLLSNVTVTPPANYEISTTSGTNFQTTPIVLTPVNNSVSQIIYVRLKSGLIAGTYAGNIVLSATSVNSQNVSLSGSVTSPTYCSMTGTTSFTTSITSVVFNTINQTSAKPSGYSDYTSISTNVILGTNHNLSVRINTDGNYECFVRVWFDWNGDGDFADSGEAYDIGSARNQTNGLTSSSPLSITIPTTSIIGLTRMRVALNYPDYPALCSTNLDGEVEDYTINILAPSITTNALSGTTFVAGASIAVPFTVNGVFKTNNVFTAQLSDASGSFSNPVNIGTLTATTNGTVNAIIPTSTPAGSAYRIRVVASSPSVVGTDNGTNISIVNGIYTSVTSIGGFSYKLNLGPSVSQSANFAGSNLSSNLRLESVSDNFEFSTSNSPFNASNVVVLPVVNGAVALTPVYIRLKAGLSIGTYTDSIRVSSTGYASKFISLSGTVTSSPNVTVAPTSLALGGYNFGGGPTASQNFTVSASRLSGAVTITPPAGFELKLNSATSYQSTALTINPDFPASNSDSLILKTVNVRMKSGLGTGLHSGNITVAALGATTRNVAVTGTVSAKASILNSTSFLGAFIYTLNAGPSPVQGFQLKVNDLAASSTITITPPAGAKYEISRTRTGTYQTTAITISNVSGNFTDSIFVRLKSGLAVGTYGPEGIIIAASGAVTKSVACVGKVVNAATLSTSISTITGFGYQQANVINPPGISNGGPSNTQTFVIAGSSLTNDATLTASTNFELSFSPNSGFATSITATRSGVIIVPRKVYVRLKSGLAVGDYSGNVTISSSGATNIQVALASAKVYASPLISASGGGDYCTGSTINLISNGGSELSNRFWEGPNGFYSVNPDPVLSTNATSALNGDYVVTANVVVGGNLVYNGNFEQGNVGFGSAYGYPSTPFSTSSLEPEGLYAITTTGSVVHSNFNSVSDHSDPGAQQMIINGNTNAGAVVWSQNVSVLPGSDYQFSYWLQTVVNGTDGAPSQLQLYINGVAAGPIYTANPTSGVWTQYVYNTYSGTSSSLNLELINQTTDAGGNDFSLDDIELTQVLYAKDTVTVAVGSALPVSVTVAVSQSSVAPNVPVTFTATAVNGGTSPIYKWIIGTDTIQSSSSNTFTTSFASTTTVKCILVSSLKCVTGNPASANTTVTIVSPPAPNYWFGAIDTDWAKAGNWTGNRVPSAGEDVVYATVANNGTAAKNDLYVDNERIVGNIINATNRKLVIPAGRQLIVNNNISFTYGVNRDSLIVIKATEPIVNGQPGAANGTLIFNNAENNPVSASVQMYSPATWDLSKPVNQKYNWQFFGIPLRSLAAVPTFTGAYVRELIESEKDTATHWRPLTNSSVLVPFKGYEICQQNTKIYTFKGQLVNANQNSGQLAKTVGALYPGQHLLANPYTCAINIKYIEFGSGVEATAYLYNTGSFTSWKQNPNKYDQGMTIIPGQYNSVPKNQAGNAGLFAQIPSMGTFLVRIPKAAASTAQSYVALNYAAVAAKNTDRQRADEYSVTKEQTSTLFTVEGEFGADRLWLMSHDTYTQDFDNGFDGLKLAGLALNPQIYAIQKDNKYQIGAVDNLNNMSLAFQAGVDTKYTIHIQNNQMLKHMYRKVYLHDLVEDVIVDIMADSSSYDFSAKSTVDPVVRFKIIAQKNVTNPNDEVYCQVYRQANSIRVQNFSSYQGRVYLYDMTGRTVAVKELNTEGNIAIPVYNHSAYIVKTVIADKTETTKLILE